MSRISVIVKQSCTSAQSIWPGPTPAIAYARCGREARGLDLDEGVLLVQVRVVGGDAEAGDVHRPVGELGGALGGHEQHRGRAVGLRAAVEEVQRMAHRRRLHHVFDRDLALEVRVRIAGAVVVVLHRHRREHLARRAELVHVARRERGEQHRRGLAAREDRVARRGTRQQAFLGRLVAHLLDADHEHDVVHAARDGHRADAERVGSRRAGVLDARARDAVEADRGRDRVAADALLAPQRAALGRDERGVDLMGLEALVDARDRGVERTGGHLLVALVEELAHLDEAGADHGHLVPRHRVHLRVPRPTGRALNPYTGTPRSCAYFRSTSFTDAPISTSVPSPITWSMSRAPSSMSSTAIGSGATNGAGIVWLIT